MTALSAIIAEYAGWCRITEVCPSAILSVLRSPHRRTIPHSRARIPLGVTDPRIRVPLTHTGTAAEG